MCRRGGRHLVELVARARALARRGSGGAGRCAWRWPASAPPPPASVPRAGRLANILLKRPVVRLQVARPEFWRPSAACPHRSFASGTSTRLVEQHNMCSPFPTHKVKQSILISTIQAPRARNSIMPADSSDGKTSNVPAVILLPCRSWDHTTVVRVHRRVSCCANATASDAKPCRVLMFWRDDTKWLSSKLR